MNDKTFTIEKNVEMTQRVGTVTSALSQTLRKMEVGDSILVTQRERNAAFAVAHGIGIKLSSRRLGSEIDQIRVWRIA